MTVTIEKDPRIGMGIRMDARLPFGKYRNFTVRAIADADHQYLDWLLEQDWFIDKYPDLVVPMPTQSLPRRTRRSRSPAIVADVAGNVVKPARWAGR